MGGAARVTELQMPSRREAVAPTVDRVLQLCHDVDLSEGRLHDLSVALAEALSNAAVHGNRLAPGTSVEVRVEVEPRRRVIVSVRDSGPGFDRAAVEDPTRDTSVLRASGRGLFLMRQLADAVEYNEEGNALRLTFVRR